MEIVNWYIRLGYVSTVLVSFIFAMVGMVIGILVRNLLRVVFEPIRPGFSLQDYNVTWGYINLRGRNMGFIVLVTLLVMLLGYSFFFAIFR